ncbi:hypothetical protein [Pararhodobacter sp. CCB-MM2]|uniref:hypothetical protein n=1 Tax=Pararhodobacter sp. CCB-MM2 TaxID=1786003 RepID=UPI000830D8C8|nr:hypothetical protein [Pararhodobacter sp. CCB-MM2]
MAKRKHLFHPDEVKQKIQTSQLINRLQKNALSDEEIMTPGQIASANALLDRVIPKLKAVDQNGDSKDVLELRITIGGE